MEKRGKRWSEVWGKGTSLEAHGFSISGIKEWREREGAAGRPSGLEDFFSQHRLCIRCQCRGVVDLGLDEDGERMWDICEICGGTGTPRANSEPSAERDTLRAKGAKGSERDGLM
jgi:hypothetical protein